jgi:spore maturation protein CgeB
VISDWNHGNAHFLRGIITALIKLGHQVKVYEPSNGWSLQNLVERYGQEPVEDYHRHFPDIESVFYSMDELDVAEVLQYADLVIVHEWNDPALVKLIGDYKSSDSHFTLLFHDTHHRAVSQPEEMRKYDLTHYDGVLAFGEVLRNIYIQNGWAKRVWTWHEAADTDIFHPIQNTEKKGDLVWIGNWGDNERTEELEEFIIQPVKALGLKADFYGVRYPEQAIQMLKEAAIGYKGWLPNYMVPRVFSQYRVTVHVPRRPYVENLPGIPTIRPFEAMASGIPLICSPWHDTEKLFTEGKDYLSARNGQEMKAHLSRVLEHPGYAKNLTEHAYHTIQNNHTCQHRAMELMNIFNDIRNEKGKVESILSISNLK